MITDFLLDHKWLSPAALIVFLVLGPIDGCVLIERPKLARWLTVVSLLPAAYVTLVPQDRRLFSRCEVQWMVPTPDRVELMANVVLFVAPVLLFAVATRRPVLALIVGSGLSMAVEAFQAAVTSLGRSCDTNDWLANTIGAAIGATLGAVALHMARRPSRGQRASDRIDER